MSSALLSEQLLSSRMRLTDEIAPDCNPDSASALRWFDRLTVGVLARTSNTDVFSASGVCGA
ncbi:MAG: hypothetical protein WA949_10855 [Phormidesmis sp.]